jgi:hypothetical protein
VHDAAHRSTTCAATVPASASLRGRTVPCLPAAAPRVRVRGHQYRLGDDAWHHRAPRGSRSGLPAPSGRGATFFLTLGTAT